MRGWYYTGSVKRRLESQPKSIYGDVVLVPILEREHGTLGLKAGTRAKKISLVV